MTDLQALFDFLDKHVAISSKAVDREHRAIRPGVRVSP